MGVFSGNLSYSRYFVEGNIADKGREFLLERLSQFKLSTLTVDSEDDQSVGWSNVIDILDTDFDTEKNFYNDYMLFSLRIDSWKIPPVLLKAHLQQSEKEFLQKTGREKLSRREKTELKLKVSRDLKSQSLPHIASYDICWDFRRGTLRFWSMSAKANQLFLDLFEKTYPGVLLVPQSPYTLAERVGLEKEELESLTRLALEPFTQPNS